MKALHFPMTRIAIRFVSFVAIALPLCARESLRRKIRSKRDLPSRNPRRY